MHELPPEISSAIVAELDVAEPDDRKGLHSLLLVSKQMNPFALRAIYKHISFIKGLRDDALGVLRSLSRYAARNPGLQFTATFSFVLARGYGYVHPPYDEIRVLLGCIISFLINARRVTIRLRSGPINGRIVRSLASCAHLTHLELQQCSMSSDDLRQFLSSHPTLEWLYIYSRAMLHVQSIKRRDPLVIIPPRLLSLSITANDMAFFENPLTSLINLNLTDTESMDPTSEASIVRHILPFASITSCRLSTFYLINILPIVTSLPHLEYLWVDRIWFEEESSEYNVLSTTKLKYLRCYVSSESGRDWERKIFDSFKMLVVVDVTSRAFQQTTRMCQGSYECPVSYRSGAWTSWWEDAKHAVEQASRPAASFASVHG
ncbi:hypothetical protein BDN71DRAFT_1457483 [Pleurotus eryngii]|uniref:F-box domain-containing protein n=1 Tax=Pleurotus eryngii TaxID=5323 RepID=A0A9P5ZIF3_PLEER|nr:hypothetical protein BDN71DRAFT_1457483 [Pleurotus eryngii]